MEEAPDIDYRGVLGRYALYGEIAAGGMATVHYGRLLGSVGFSRTVAIKRLHPHLARDPDFVKMFLSEAKLAARVRHPNVVPTLDVVELEGEILLVMEYVEGESLSRLVRVAKRDKKPLPPRVITGIMCNVLEGLHAAHEAMSEKGVPLGIVHRDVSPQNVLVGADGVARVLDFGVAKATSRASETRNEHIKGKISYMAPEQLARGAIDRRTDIFSAAVVMWQALTGEKLFTGEDVATLVYAIVSDPLRPPSLLNPEVSPELDAVVLRGLDRDQEARWPTARDMALALEKACPPAPVREIGQWVADVCGDAIEYRAAVVAEIEAQSSTNSIPPEPAAKQIPRLSSKPTQPEMPIQQTTEPMPAVQIERPITNGSAVTPAGVGVGVAAPAAPEPRSRLMIAFLAIAILVVLGSVVAMVIFARAAANDGANGAAPPPSVSTDETAISIGTSKTPVVPPRPTTSSSAKPR